MGLARRLHGLGGISLLRRVANADPDVMQRLGWNAQWRISNSGHHLPRARPLAIPSSGTRYQQARGENMESSLKTITVEPKEKHTATVIFMHVRWHRVQSTGRFPL